MSLIIERPVLRQVVKTTPLLVTTDKQKIDATADFKKDLISTVAIGNASDNSAAVWWGDSNVRAQAGYGFEIVAGGFQSWAIPQQDQQIDLQSPLLELYRAMCCKPALSPESVPLVVWDLAQLWVVASAPITVTLGTFRITV